MVAQPSFLKPRAEPLSTSACFFLFYSFLVIYLLGKLWLCVFAVVSLWKSENNFWGVSSLGIELKTSRLVQMSLSIEPSCWNLLSLLIERSQEK